MHVPSGDSPTDRLGNQLVEAVIYHDVPRTRDLLRRGADANFVVANEFDPHSQHPDLQPKTPLQFVVFCISDALLTETDRRQFLDITILLLKAGADRAPAARLAAARYGTAAVADSAASSGGSPPRANAFEHVLALIREG